MEDNNINNTTVGNDGKKSIQTSLTSEAYEWAESIVFALAVVVLIFTFMLRPVGVDGISMMNTLQNGDKVVICNIDYVPKQGDIIVLSTKAVPQPIIKRVIAVGGQTVDINYNTNKVYVDGKEYDAPIKEKMTPVFGSGTTKLPVKIPEGCVFVMGDNRNNSMDSRYTDIGIINDDNILGHAVFRILPLNTFGFLH